METASNIDAGWLDRVLATIGIYRDIPRSLLAARYCDARSQRIEVDGAEIHFKDEGEGEPLVLIHGIASSLHTWDGWAAALSDRFRVVRFDLPGFGLSDPLADGDYSIGGLARFLARFVERLGLPPCHVAGNSMGGMIAWHFARLAPERSNKLILVDTGGYFRGKLMAVRVGRLPLLGRLMRYFTPKRLLAKNIRQTYGDPSRVSPQLLQRYHDLLRHRGNRAAMIARIRSDWVFDPAMIRAISNPTLLLWGALDRVLPVEMAQRYASDIANAQLKIYPQLGHVPMEEEPEETARDVAEFLQQRSPARREAPHGPYG